MATNKEDQEKPTNMEVEVKLRLADAAARSALAKVLLPCFKTAHDQENNFFDGSNKELSSQRVVLRLRIYNKDRKAVITVKGKQILENGIGRSTEEEESVDPILARTFIQDPAALLEHNSPLMAKIKEQYKLKGLDYLGGFVNLRQEYAWKGHTLELDETSYPWGTLYELECESTKPEEVKAELEALLEQHHVGFTYSTKSKFANFVEKTLE